MIRAFLLGCAVGWLLLRRLRRLVLPYAPGFAERNRQVQPTSRWWVDGDTVHVVHSGPASGDWQTWTDGSAYAEALPWWVYYS